MSTNLQRLLDAQTNVYAYACAELRAGQKETHWMWFIFPQLKGLGSSSTAQKYAIQDLDEARAYLDHPLLGSRLRECTKLVNAVNGRPIEAIFGFPDHLKFHSSMSLFAHVSAADQEFTAALNKYFEGKKDPGTVKLL